MNLTFLVCCVRGSGIRGIGRVVGCGIVRICSVFIVRMIFVRDSWIFITVNDILIRKHSTLLSVIVLELIMIEIVAIPEF